VRSLGTLQSEHAEVALGCALSTAFANYVGYLDEQLLTVCSQTRPI
jgi:hypothetical protein